MSVKLFLILSVKSSLQLFGAFWIWGGFLTLEGARQSLFMDRVLDALSSKKENRLLTYFLFIGSVLTILTGSGLVLASFWLFLPLSLLIVSQIIYFALQKRRFQRATQTEEREEALVSPATINAFKVSLGVFLAASVGGAIGALH